MERERQIMGRRRARLRPEQQILQMHQRHRCPKEAPVTRNATQAPRAATAASRAAAPATNQGAAKPAASRNTSQRQAPSRSAVGRSASQRGAARAAAGDDFMNVASGMEEGLPFN